MTQENHADERTLDTLTRALRVLDDTSRDATLVAPAFFLRMLEIEGAGPIVDSCASCGRDDVELVAFDLVEGGTLCRSCRRGRPLSPEGLELLRRIVGGDLAGVLAGAPPAGAVEVEELATTAMESHLDRRLRAARTSAGI